MTATPLLAQIRTNYIIILLINIILFSTFLIYISTPKNIINENAIRWGPGWIDSESNFSGSEIDFTVNNTKTLTVEFSNFTNADQGLEVKIDKTKSTKLFSKISKYSMKLSIPDKKVHIITIRHICSVLVHPCGIKLTGLITDRHAKIMPVSNNKKNISILGDSISTIDGENNYSVLLSDALNMRLHNASIMGSTASPVHNIDCACNRIEKDIKPYLSEYSIIFIGTNDLGNKVHLSVFKKNYTEIVKKIMKWNPKTKLFLIGIPLRLDETEYAIQQYNAIISDTALNSNAIYVDTYNWLAREQLADDIHPTKEAQVIISEKLKSFLVE